VGAAAQVSLREDATSIWSGSLGEMLTTVCSPSRSRCASSGEMLTDDVDIGSQKSVERHLPCGGHKPMQQ
jgi:hypothetical protein